MRRAHVYYNENDPRAAAWLRELVKEKAIAHGSIDERSIEDIRPRELVGFSQHHFFAGIGGWSAALRLAGWPDNKAVCTGSCPCQPFSQAGARRGFRDERHLWPAFLHIISIGQPSIVFGEQVASSNGRAWLAVVQTDLEGLGYAFGASDLCAASVGAPHARQRLYWVADDSRGRRFEKRQECNSDQIHNATVRSTPGHDAFGRSFLGDAERIGGQTPGVIASPRKTLPTHTRQETRAAKLFHAWREVEWVACWDGRIRPTQPSIHPLAHGISGRVGLLRGYGNAIVPQVAATFIKAVMGIR